MSSGIFGNASLPPSVSASWCFLYCSMSIHAIPHGTSALTSVSFAVTLSSSITCLSST